MENNAFLATKKIVGLDVLLSYPNFSEKFMIQTEASRAKLGGVMSQNRKPIAFYSLKLTPSQLNYMTTEIELLSTVENLK